MHDATPTDCPSGQEPNGAVCVCSTTLALPVDGSCMLEEPSSCQVEDCVDDGNPCTEPSCAMGASSCSHLPLEDLSPCEHEGGDGSCISGQCVLEEPIWELGDPFRIGGDGAPIARPAVAIGADGSAIAVWLEGGALRSSRLIAEVGWNEPVTLDDNVDPARLIDLDADAQGNAIVAYARLEQSSIDIRTLRYDAGLGTWDTPTVISREGAVATRPCVDLTPSGEAFVTWWEAPASILVARRASGALSWSEAVPISPDDGFDKEPPFVSIADDGRGGVIFAGHGPSLKAERVWFVPLGPGAFVGAPVEIDASTEETQSTHLAASNGGVQMAVWEQGDDIWGAHFSAGIWEPATRLEVKSSWAVNEQVVPIGAGDFVAVWVQGAEIRARRYSSTDSVWKDLIILNNAGGSYRPSLVPGAEDEAWVAWLENDRIRLRHFVSASGWSTDEVISPVLAAGAPREHRPSLARAADGTIVAVWADGTDVWTWVDAR